MKNNWTEPYYGFAYYKKSKPLICISIDCISHKELVFGTIIDSNQDGGKFTYPVARITGKSTKNMKRRLLKIAKEKSILV